MKNNIYKEFAPGVIAHVYNRGNNKEEIFLDEQDYKAFLFRIALALGFKQEELKNEGVLNMPYSRIRITETEKNCFSILPWPMGTNISRNS